MPVFASTVQIVVVEVAKVTAPLPLPPLDDRVSAVLSEFVSVVRLGTTVSVAWAAFAIVMVTVPPVDSFQLVSVNR